MRATFIAAVGACLLTVLVGCAVPVSPGQSAATGVGTPVEPTRVESAPSGQAHGQASENPNPTTPEQSASTASAVGHWTSPRLTPGVRVPRRPALPKEVATSGATLRLRGNWAASADLVGSAGARLRCSHYEQPAGRQHLYIVSSDPAVMDMDALGIGKNQYAVSIEVGPDGRGKQVADLFLRVKDQDSFEGWSASRVMSPTIPIIYRVSKDWRSLQVAAKVVTSPSGNYSRAADIGETAITVSLRCPK